MSIQNNVQIANIDVPDLLIKATIHAFGRPARLSKRPAALELYAMNASNYAPHHDLTKYVFVGIFRESQFLGDRGG